MGQVLECCKGYTQAQSNLCKSIKKEHKEFNKLIEIQRSKINHMSRNGMIERSSAEVKLESLIALESQINSLKADGLNYVDQNDVGEAEAKLEGLRSKKTLFKHVI